MNVLMDLNLIKEAKQKPNIPTFHYSNCERSERSSDDAYHSSACIFALYYQKDKHFFVLKLPEKPALRSLFLSFMVKLTIEAALFPPISLLVHALPYLILATEVSTILCRS
jgi:hypothetical protein